MLVTVIKELKMVWHPFHYESVCGSGQDDFLYIGISALNKFP